MSACITELTEIEFHQQASLENNSAMFNNSLYEQKITFSLPMKKQALRYCQKLIQENLNTVLVQCSYCFIVWIEKKKAEALTIEPKNNFAVIEPLIASIPENISQEAPIKKITKVYRGQTYEVEIPDYSNLQNSVKNKSIRRKYRGQYID